MPYTCYRAHCDGITVADLVTRVAPAGITAAQIGKEGRLFRLTSRAGSSKLLVYVNSRGRLYALTSDPTNEGSPQRILEAICEAFDIKKIEKIKLQETSEFFIMENP